MVSLVTMELAEKLDRVKFVISFWSILIRLLCIKLSQFLWFVFIVDKLFVRRRSLLASLRAFVLSKCTKCPEPNPKL